MNILLSWKLVVSLIIFMNDLPSSELKSSADPASSVARNAKPPTSKIISSFQYDKICIHIYDSQTTLRNKKIYFYTPIALLEPLNVVPVPSQTSNTQGILRISFAIWNQTVTEKVVQHLTRFLNETVEPNQVQVYPFNSVRLTSKVQSVDFSLTNEWQAFDKTRHKLGFDLNCPTKQDCDKVKKGITRGEIKHLRLEFDPKLNDDTCSSSGVGISQEDFAKQLEEAKQELLANFEAKLAKELKTFREVASENLEKTKSELTQTKADLSHLTTKLNLSQKELDLTRTELIQMKSYIEDTMKKFSGQTITNVTVETGQMPTSCADLERMGHKLSGFFSVKGSKKMEMVYCSFHPNQNAEKQKWIGYVDVKSAPVHFYVQRSASFNKMGIPIPWDLAIVNEGNAMDLTTGKFTAPRPGIYFFSFTGLAEFPASSSLVRLAIAVYWNGDRLGAGFVEESNTLENQNSPLNFQSTLNLKKNDQVWLQIDAVSSGDDSLYDDAFHYTHFTGFVLEEEIVDSII